MSKYFLIVIVFISFSFSFQNEWSTTPIDKFINHNFKKMTFREPFYLIPYDLKIGLFSYGGPNYFSEALKGNFNLTNNPIILDNQDIDNLFISSTDSRTGFFIEADVMKYNLLEKLYHQNLIDLHLGGGLRYSNILSNPIAPIYISNNTENYRFRPMMIDGFLNLSVISQFSSKFYIYSYYSFGLSYTSIYESLSQKKYINGSGFNENFSIGYKYIIENLSLPYNYAVGFELRSGRTLINKIYDDKNETPIIGLDMNTFGLFITFGTLFGGKETKGDQAFDLMLDKDYINAVKKYKQFLNIYNHDFRFEKAKKMLNFCYTQIPYQYFDMGLENFYNNKYDLALENFNKAEQTADPSLILEIESYKRDIAKALISKTDKNLDKNTFFQSIKTLNRARNISPYMWPETDKIEAKILVKKGNILKDLSNYAEAVDFYQQALELDPTLFIEINDKYTELVTFILNDINDTDSPNELKLVKEYLKTIIQLRPRYHENLSNYINIIDDKLKNYEHQVTKVNLKEYVAERRKKTLQNLNKKIVLGMSFNEIEFILGQPDIIKKDGIYDLWIYYKSDKDFQTYFFKDYLLIKID